jgi:ATP-dependent DNA helicase RecQ
MEEIASERNLAISTIEGHLAGFVATGELDLSLLVPEQIRDRIIEAWEKDPAATHGILKRVLGDDISYGQIRAVLGWKQRQAETLAK